MSPRRLLLALALVALALAACVPAADLSPIPEDRAAVLPGARTGTVDHDRFRTAYEVAGDGPAVVLVHGVGGGSSVFQWRRNVAALTEAGFRTYALDLHGFGRSTGPQGLLTNDLLVSQIAMFLDEVVEEPAVVVANGLSAAFAIRVASERPDAVAGLVLVGPTGYERLARPPGPERVLAFERLAGLAGEALYAVLLEEGVQRLFLLDAYAGRDSLDAEIRATYDRNLRTPFAKWAVLSFVTGNLDQDVSQLWPRLDLPSLIVWGADATTTPIADAEPFVRDRPEVRLLPLANAKLLPNEDRADAFDAALLAFLRSFDFGR